MSFVFCNTKLQYFYLEDSKLTVASTSEQGITRLSDIVPSDSLTEAAIIHAVSKAFYPAAFSSNTVVWSSNTLSAVAIQADWTSNLSVNTSILAAYCSNLTVSSSNALFPSAVFSSNASAHSSNLVDTAISKADSAQSTADAGLAAGTAAGVTAAGASVAAAAANGLAVTAAELATANQASLALHDVRIARAQISADAAGDSAASAQNVADHAQQTACNALNKTQHWDFTQDSIQNLQQPTLELTYSNEYIHVNKSLQVTDGISCSSLLSRDSLQVQTAASTQFSVSNGTCYVGSNLQMSNTAVIQAVDDAHAGVVKVTPDALRFYTTFNGTEKLSFSANSNGIFALSRCALFGPNETLYGTGGAIARLEMSLADGLRFGSGIRSQLVGPDRDLLRIDSNGDISCYSRSSGLLEGLTSNACVTKGTLKLQENRPDHIEQTCDHCSRRDCP